MYFADLAAGGLCAVIWIYLLFSRGGYWRIGAVRPPAARSGSPNAKIAVIIPARNEAHVIARSLESLLAQDYPGQVRIFVVDDSSTDATPEIVLKMADESGSLISLIHGTLLPSGWTGKLWAMQQGIAEAANTTPDLFLLTDADIFHAPDEISTLVSLANSGAYDLCSFMVKLNRESVPEKFLVPAFVYFFFMLYPPAWIRDSNRAIAGAAGGCMLVRPRALAQSGGLESIRGEIIDDCALARTVKRNGEKVWLGLAPESRSLRSYGSFAEIGRMISRTAFNQLQHSVLLLMPASLGMLATFIFPVALLFSRHAAPVALGIAASAAMFLSYLPMVRFYRLNPLWALAFPIAALFYIGATLHSAVMYWLGRGGEWKGRAQDLSASAATRRSS